MDGVVKSVQNVVHGSSCTLVVPGMLLTGSAVMLAYRRATEDKFDLPLNGFLATIMLQMMPLVALKAKIWSNADRVSLVPLVLVKTLMMHVCLEVLRIISQAIVGIQPRPMYFAVDCCGLLAALAILKYSFEAPISPMQFLRHIDVRNLVLLACIGALSSEAFFVYVQPFWMTEADRAYIQDGVVFSKVLFLAANYVDVVAFMPVVWRLYQAENELEEHSCGTVVSEHAQRQARIFFGYVFLFYLWDDVIDPIMSLLDEPLGMMAHAAHFMLLLDFAGFFTFQVNTPSIAGSMKERGEQLQGLLSESGLDQDD